MGPTRNTMGSILPEAIGLAALVLGLLSYGCGASGAASVSSSSSSSGGAPRMAPGMPASESYDARYGFDEALPAAPEAAPAPAPVLASAASHAASPSVVTDANAAGRPLLVYTAHLVLAVYEVNPTQEKLLALVREAGGFLSTRDDHTLVVRVPAARFEEVFASMQKVGDVQSRTVQVEDVGDQLRDLEIRIQNAKSIRSRLEELLARAQSISDALQIERELERVTAELERMKGQLRHLAERIAYSTITVHFRPRGQEHVDDAVRLPFPWLEQLGLSNLLRLR